MQDTFKHKGLRKILVEKLIGKGITNKKVLTAIGEIPRHQFITDNAFLQSSYEDIAFPIGAGQTISQPYTVAVQSSLLEIKPGDKVLEVGTGSGYQTAVLIKLGAKVFSIERQRELFNKTKMLLPEIGFRARFFYGDGYKGIPMYAPYNKVIVTAGAPFIPEALKEQVVIGGKIVIPVGDGDDKSMVVLTKISETEFKSETFDGIFRFVPMLQNKQ
jgi:protein-L-isoaspartate(D-aspartate) O-methyltransferase